MAIKAERAFTKYRRNLLNKFQECGCHVIHGNNDWYNLNVQMQRYGVDDLVDVTVEVERRIGSHYKRTLKYDYEQLKEILYTEYDQDDTIELIDLYDESLLPDLLKDLLNIRKQYAKLFTVNGHLKSRCGPKESKLWQREQKIVKYRQVFMAILENPEIYGHVDNQ